MEKTEKTNHKITYISFILCVLVVSIHTYNVTTYGFTGETASERALIWFESRLNSFESVCVPFFFFLSGYLLFRNFDFSKKGILKKYKSRFFSLFIPYMIWNTLYFIFYTVLTHIGPLKRLINFEPVELSLKNYLSMLWNNTYSPLWFMLYLMIMIVPFPLYYILFRITRQKYTWILGPVSFIAVFLLTTEWFPYRIPYIQPTFILGTFLAINFKEMFEKEHKAITISAIVIFICVIILLCMYKSTGTVWNIVVIISVWYMFDAFSFTAKEPKKWMYYSFFIYCAHDFILEALEKLWLIFVGKKVWAATIDFLFAPVITVSILILVANFIKKTMPGVWKVINGNRG